MLALSAIPASAIPVDNLDGFEDIFGTYAPDGDCSHETWVAIGRTGIQFLDAGNEIVSHNPDFAASYMGNFYEGIMRVFFPLASGNDLGPIILTANDGETPGRIRIEATDGPPADPMLAAMVKVGVLTLCEGTGSGIAPVAPEAPPRANLIPLTWENLAEATGKFPGQYSDDNIDLFDQGDIATALKRLMGNKMETLMFNLGVVSDLRREGSRYYVTGNAQHRGGEDQAYVLIDQSARTLQVGLWEAGKLTVYAPDSGRIDPPADIRKQLDQSPGEDAVALPGTPWRVLEAPGNPPVAIVDVAASPRIKSVTAVCLNGRPTLGILLNRPHEGQSMTTTWIMRFGGIADLPLSRADRGGMLWEADLTGSALPANLMRSPGTVILRINSVHQGEASLSGSGAAIKSALSPCTRL